VDVIGIIAAAAALFIGLAVGGFVGVAYRKKFAESEIGSAETEAKRIVSEAVKVSETKKKESLLEAKEEVIKMKNEADRDAKERRSEITKLERDIAQKEET
jgi:ribonuclease Y